MNYFLIDSRKKVQRLTDPTVFSVADYFASDRVVGRFALVFERNILDRIAF